MSAQPTVVLIHGLFGFDRLLWLEYFRQARSLYGQMGMRVIVPKLPWAGTIKQRASALAEQLATQPGPLHLIAHSMGGVDARYWITHLGGGAKVASLTTLGTPHHGSPVADHVCSTLSPFRLFAGVHALTTIAMRQFNADTPDHDGVIYRSYAGARPLAQLPWLMRRYARIIEQAEGDNDSQVSRQSAAWGDLVSVVPADHFELMSLNIWLNPFRRREPFDPLPLYRDIGCWILQQQ
ncbi:lipase family alpha/beta hydrolase [Mariprofundus ferrooxydans]|uniref:Esterase/lipase/thioesterase family active site n=1 Tax=Mariprofundus ferrooxydans PV-1 TaxID=314345 RepID=Q0EZ31_9PROT|nr:alpha/beta fold hydrolase [Mariprofundus ferrooxydans]EAU54593.1 esterase/lipase/thioesterase family active site [Mariprofundus ferrooxydans PV-1]KON48799.1 thioesterase [Mariprofundus ferrooxydans]